MIAAPQWHLRGDWFDVCSCDIPCPCEFAQAPTNNYCEGVQGLHIREGRYGDVSLGGLNILIIGSFEGNIWAGETKLSAGLFFDERADEQQRAALQAIFGGQVGGWPAVLADLIDLRGVADAPIMVEVDGDLASWRAEIPGQVRAAAEALSGPTTPEGKRVQLLNPPGSEVGPGQIATWGSGDVEQQTEAFDIRLSFVGQSSKHIPFEWSGPDQ